MIKNSTFTNFTSHILFSGNVLVTIKNCEFKNNGGIWLHRTRGGTMRLKVTLYHSF